MRRRRIRHRNRRITAGVLAIAVAAGGSALAFQAFGHHASTKGTFGTTLRDPELVFDISPDATLTAGEKLTLRSTLPTGTEIYAGVTYSSAGCEPWKIDAFRIGPNGLIRFGVASPSCREEVTYPVAVWVTAFTPNHRLPAGTPGYSERLLMSLRRRGLIQHLTLIPARLVSRKATTQAGPYPRGAFEACPDMKSVIETDGAGADHVALRFSRLWASGRHGKAHRYMDRSARKLENWAAAGDPTKMRILGAPGKPARHDGLVRYGCGPAVADRSWEVVIDDGTSSASLDFTIYLVRRPSGWKVWGSY